MGNTLLSEVLIARQPILDDTLAVAGYELLFRDVDGLAPPEPAAGCGVRATAAVVIDGLLGIGRDELTGDTDAWINVPSALLLDHALLDVPSEGLVLELLEGDEPDGLAEAIDRHRTAGFRVALDDVVPGDPRLALVDRVDVVKIDLVAAGVVPGLRLIRQLASHGCTVVAEKVEDPAIFDRAKSAGARLFQGYFFTRPLAVRGMRPIGLTAGHLPLLAELVADEVDLREVERLIRSDLMLSDRFLRLVSVRASGHRVASIHDGLVLLGVQAVRRWVSLLTLAATVRDRPAELMAVASTRARGCELLEELRGGDRRLEAFSLGMFSVLGVEGRLTPDVLHGLPLSADVRDALEHGRGSFRTMLEVVLAAERADWERLVRYGRSLGIEPAPLARAHADALAWSVELERAAS